MKTPTFHPDATVKCPYDGPIKKSNDWHHFIPLLGDFYRCRFCESVVFGRPVEDELRVTLELELFKLTGGNDAAN